MRYHRDSGLQSPIIRRRRNGPRVPSASQLRRLKFVLALIQLCELPVTLHFQAAGADELYDSPQFTPVKPGAMRSANIHHHVRAMREISPVHQLVAHRTRDIADRFHSDRIAPRRRRSHSDDRGLLLPVGADLLQRSRVCPDTFTTRTLSKIRVPDLDCVHLDVAPRALFAGLPLDFSPVRARAAVRTELRPDKHHSETREAL